MEWYKNSQDCLSEANETLEKIKSLMVFESDEKDNLSKISIKTKIFLELCRSPLDFVANYIFNTYCKKHYQLKEIKKIKVYFPIYFSKNLLNVKKNINENFKNLERDYPEIFSVLLNVQAASGSKKLITLSKLVNENKHNRLSRNEKKVTRYINHYAKDSYGNVFQNNIMSGPNDIIINGHSLVASSSQEDSYFTVNHMSYRYSYFFSDLNLELLYTLESILKEVESIIEKLRLILSS